MPARKPKPMCANCQWFDGLHGVCTEPRRLKVQQSYDMGGTSIMRMVPRITDGDAVCDFHTAPVDPNFRDT